MSDVSPDYWSYTVPAGQAIRVWMTTDPIQADVDLTLYGAPACQFSDVLDGASTISAVETVEYVNRTGMARDVFLFVWMFSGTCGDYGLEVEVVQDQCLPGTDDALEPNDTCPTAVNPGSSPVAGLFLSATDPDFYAFTIPPRTLFMAKVSHALDFDPLALRIRDAGDCSTLANTISGVNGVTELSWDNQSSGSRAVVLEVSKGVGGLFTCQDNYTLEWTTGVGSCASFPPDSFDPNEDCASASSITPGSYLGLTVRKPFFDEDWYQVALPANSTLNVSALFSASAGDIDLELYLGCGGFLVSEGTTITDNESVSYSNTTGSSVTMVLQAFIWPGDFNECTDYDLNIGIQPIGTNFTAFCFGDGSGAQCPCSNNSSPGHLGGCAHQDGDGAILLPSGLPSVSNDGLSFDLVSGAFSTFGLLVSGDNQLPQMGNCIACGIQAFDGFRCAGGNFRRHGIRSIVSNGSTLNPWGAASGNSIIASSGFVAGQSRSFFVFYRTDANATCGTGQNSSNAVQVTFAP